MSKGNRIAPQTREEVLRRIQDDGVPAAQAAREHGVSHKTVYNWLSKKAVALPNILQINKLKRENDELYRLLGKTVAQIERSKKNRSGYGV